jgi:protein phosphatase
MERKPSRHEDTLSARIYRLLLLAYPRAFREEYATEMLLTFRAAFYEAACCQGSLGVLCLWGDIVRDLVKTVCIEHASAWRRRVRPNVALSGHAQPALLPPFTLEVAQRTDIGRKRAHNEDHLLTAVPGDDPLLRTRGALFVVADGMGGQGNGAVASELAAQTTRAYYYQDHQRDIPAALIYSIQQANAAVCDANTRKQLQEAGGLDMGTTCVAAVLHEQTLYVANVGDSRVYVLHEGRLRQVTRDHSLVAKLVERGELSAAEGRAHPQRALIYRALGSTAVEPDIFIEPMHEGDTFILCSDGLHSVVEDEEMRTIVERYSPEESAQLLIARANTEGGPDNVTAIVVHVSSPS